MARELVIPPKYPYVYETHLHTSNGSACGNNTAQEMVNACKKAGYTGIIVTDHFYGGNTCISKDLPWEEWVEQYYECYEAAKEEGDRIGLQVFFGWEQSFEGNDFLVYGLDKEWLLAHPEIKDAFVDKQYEMVHKDGGIVIHAHPFREEWYVKETRLFPEYVDGVETSNAAHIVNKALEDGSVPFDDKARAYAKKYNFPETGGSDIHSVDLFAGGMAFKRKLTDIHDFTKAVLSREGIVLS